MALVYGFGGMRDDEGILRFRPRRAPDQPARLQFPLTYHGQILDVELGPDAAIYSLREGEGLVIWHEEEEIKLSPDNPVVTRPIVIRKPS